MKKLSPVAKRFGQKSIQVHIIQDSNYNIRRTLLLVSMKEAVMWSLCGILKNPISLRNMFFVIQVAICFCLKI